MNSSGVLVFVTQAGHLLGLAGVMVCLLLLYYQIFQIFLPRPEQWRSYKISRLLMLVQRFLWLTWLCGVSLLMTANMYGSGWKSSNILFDKVIVLFLLSLTTLGIDLLVKRLFNSLQGGNKVFSSPLDAIGFKFCFAASISLWFATLYLIYCYGRQLYTPGIAVLLASGTFIVVFSILLSLNNRWLNTVSSKDSGK